uniref:G-protein coupled receptors family 1 profile domain-containing protein n=1 Tax=Capitella teleta TaxID=283909 RepID=X2B1Y7_CAPTE
MNGFDLYRFIVDVYVVGFLCLFGFIGNALSIAVLYRDRGKKNTTNWLLQTLAVGDTLYLMACVFIQPLKTINTQTNWIPGLKNTLPYLERYIWAAASIAQTITVWTVLLVTLDRFMAICKPLSTQLRSLERAKLTVTIVIVLAILYNIPRFFEREVVIEVNKQCNTTYVKVDKSAMRQSKIYFLVYKTICYFIFRAIGPLLTLIILNYKLIKALQEVRRRHEDLTRSGKHRENITLMLVVVVCVFIVCTLPDLFLRLIVAFREFFPHLTRGLQWHWLSAMNVITNMLLVINSSINFLIYCLIGKKFRKILTQMF